jgi:membrane-associated protease RseP (regulator of RpoE activity)
MLKKMLAAALAVGLMTNGASAQVSDAEAKARKEAEVARARAERAADQSRAEMEKMRAQLAAMKKQMAEMEKQLEGKRADGEAQRDKAREALKKAMAAREGVVAGGKKEAFIGVVTDKAPEALAEHLGFKDGVVVKQVLKDSPAEKAGLKNNDILLSMNDTVLTSPEQFKKLIVGETGGAKATFVILRGGKKEKINATLGERDANKFGGMFFDGKGAEFRALDGDAFQFKFGGDNPFGKEGVWEKQLPGGAKVFGRAKAGAKIGEGGAGNTISIEVNDGRISVSASTTKDGKTQSVTETGTKEELLKKIDKFPEGVRDSIRRSLEGIEVGPGGKGSRIRIQNKAQADAGKDGEKIRVHALDPKHMAELELMHADALKAHADVKVQVLDAHKGALKELEGMKIELKKLEGLKGLEGMKVQLEKLGDLKDLEALKDLDVKVRVLDGETLKSLGELKDKLPKEIELEITKSLKDLGQKDKLKDKLKEKVLIERRDSQ